MATITHYEVSIRLVEHLLGTIPKDRDVYTNFIRTKAPEGAPEENVAEPTAEEIEEKGWTGFYRDPQDGCPILYDYQIKGFLKEAANTLKDDLKLTALRSAVESFVFVSPRTIPLAGRDDVLPFIERPLRAMTMQGPRVTVVRSDYIPAGTTLAFELSVFVNKKVDENVLREILDFGTFKGLGQWRNGGYGRFEVVRFEAV